MTRKQLQDALKPYKQQFPYIKLNAKTEQLQAWWEMICNFKEVKVNSQTDSNQTEELTGQSCELTCAVRLPKVIDIKQAVSPSFGAVAIAAVSIVLDGVRCFADMAKQVYKSVAKKRKNPVGFAV